jgi:hypothetical protein
MTATSAILGMTLFNAWKAISPRSRIPYRGLSNGTLNPVIAGNPTRRRTRAHAALMLRRAG